MNAKEQNIDVTVVCELKLKNWAPIIRQKNKGLFPNSRKLKADSNPTAVFLQSCQCPSTSITKKKTKTKQKGKKNNSFLH